MHLYLESVGATTLAGARKVFQWSPEDVRAALEALAEAGQDGLPAGRERRGALCGQGPARRSPGAQIERERTPVCQSTLEVIIHMSDSSGFDHTTYLSPFTWRYGSSEMRRIWSETRRRHLWRRVWVALARAQMRAGSLPRRWQTWKRTWRTWTWRGRRLSSGKSATM